jgi:GTP cyclohydrolase II
MFAYLDPGVRQRLLDEGRLFRVNSTGQKMDGHAPLNDSGRRALDIMGPIPLPITLGDLQLNLTWYPAVGSSELARVDELAAALREKGDQRHFASLVSAMAVNSVLMYGDPMASEHPLVRVHSSCMTGDVFGSQRCECGPQFMSALARIANEPGGGMVVYMAGHEGRGIGLWAKAAAYLLQDAGEDTYQANRSLGLPDDSRDFGDAATLLLHFLGDRPIRVLTNNPCKLSNLAQHGLTQLSAEKHVVGVGEANRRYMAAKREWGHQLEDGDLS